MKILSDVLLSGAISFGILGGWSNQGKIDSKDEIIALHEKTNNYLVSELNRTREELNKERSIAFEYKDKYSLEEMELKDLKHIVATFDNGRVDTVFVPKPVIDTAALRKVQIEKAKEVDSLKQLLELNKMLSRKKEIGVRPNN